MSGLARLLNPVAIPPEFAVVAIVVVAKVTLLLAVTTVITAVLRRSSAAVRHHVWLVAIFGAMMIPLLAAFPGPVVQLPEGLVPNQWVTWSRQVREISRSASTNPQLSPSLASASIGEPLNGVTADDIRSNGVVAANGDQRMATTAMGASGSAQAESERPSANGSEAQLNSSLAPIAPHNDSPPLETVHAVESTAFAEFLIALLAAVWVGGVVVQLAWRALGHVILARMLKRASTVSNEQWLHMLRQTMREFGIHREVALYAHSDIRAPMTTGWLRPIIVLPADADSYSGEARRAVLTHELAHIARSDYLAQTITALATALLWFHPGVWFAAARLRAESERAADDCVLNTGMEADRYAFHLLALADRSHFLHEAAIPAIGMARVSQLEGRLRAMLNEKLSRRSLSVRAQLLMGGASLAMIVPLATAQVRATVGDTTVRQGVALPKAAVASAAPPSATRGAAMSKVAAPSAAARTVVLPSVAAPSAAIPPAAVPAATALPTVTALPIPAVSRAAPPSVAAPSATARSIGMPSAAAPFDTTSEQKPNAASRATMISQCGPATLSQVAGSLDTSSFRTAATGNSKGPAPLLIVDGIPLADFCTFMPRMSPLSDVNQHSASGNVSVDSAPHGGRISAKDGSIRLGSSGAVVVATARKGDIELFKMSGDASVVVTEGNVLVQIVNTNGTQHFVSTRSWNGNVTIEVPDSIDATIDVETAYTPTFVAKSGRGTRIISDRPLERSETTDWAATDNMTARKYVRATGRFGAGHGRIYIRAANGDVNIRRAPPR